MFYHKNYKIMFYIILMTLLFSCNNQEAPQEKATFVANETETKGLQLLPDAQDNLAVTGDFNGDGVTDAIRENFKPIPNDEDGVGTCGLVDPTNQLPALDLGERCTGLRYLQNEGDLNKDGADEISLVRDWYTGFSREVEIFTLQNGQWKLLDVFSINISFLLGDNPTYDYNTLVMPAAGGYTVYEYDATNPQNMWQRREGKQLKKVMNN